MFVGRRKELALLREELAAPRASLAIVYGRRRVGKSTLIREAVEKRPHVLYQATRVTSSLDLEAFTAGIARMLGADDLLAGIERAIAQPGIALRTPQTMLRSARLRSSGATRSAASRRRGV